MTCVLDIIDEYDLATSNEHTTQSDVRKSWSQEFTEHFDTLHGTQITTPYHLKIHAFSCLGGYRKAKSRMNSTPPFDEKPPKQASEFSSCRSSR